MALERGSSTELSTAAFQSLAQAAAPAVGSRACVRLSKLSEGSFNKAFVLTMDDGKRIVAKIPNPNAGREHLTTASEVATMDYARNVLGIPAPLVYDWSSSPDNPVGAEYILMEYCPGVELHKVWDKITDRQKATIVHTLVSYEAGLSSSEFPMYGSLYYAKDLDLTPSRDTLVLKSGSTTKYPEFAIGPTTDRNFSDHGRADASTKHGPWPSVEEYNIAIAARQYHQDHETKLRTLRNYEKVAHHLKPKDPALAKPVLWHTDLHWDNIFVDENDPTKITAIIDWQAIHVAPLFAHARHPTFLEFDGEIPNTFDAEVIKLPDDFNNFSPVEQEAAKRLRGAQILWKLYEVELVCQCEDVIRAIRFGEGLLGRLPSLAGNIYSDGELLVEDLLMSLERQWVEIVDDPVSDPCPLSFTDDERSAHGNQVELWTQSIELMTDFLTSLGEYRGWDGSVSHEQYSEVKQLMDRFKEEFISQHSSTDAERMNWLQAWPFPE